MSSLLPRTSSPRNLPSLIINALLLSSKTSQNQPFPTPQPQIQTSTFPPPIQTMPSRPGPTRSEPDYLDKGLYAIEKKFGGQRFADPDKYRAVNQKITDFLRKMIEKVTGKKEPAKFSN